MGAARARAARVEQPAPLSRRRRAMSASPAPLGNARRMLGEWLVDKPVRPASLGRIARPHDFTLASSSRIGHMSDRHATMTKAVCRDARNDARSIDFSPSVGKALERKG